MEKYILIDPNDIDNPPRQFTHFEGAYGAKVDADSYYKSLGSSFEETRIYKKVLV